MRLIFTVLFLLTLITQYPLWWGKGGWLQVHELQKKVSGQLETNEALVTRNNALQAEVSDLKQGTQAIEERARSELGMIHEDEIFVQILDPKDSIPHLNAPKLPASKPKKGD